MRRRLPGAALGAAVALLALAGSAHAVVGGSRVGESSAPWFVGTGLCGGTLIAPDRLATAAHCFDPVDMADLARIDVAGEIVRGTRVALPPTWRQRRAGFALEDIAIVGLDRPVTGVEPAALPAPGAAVPRRVRILGRGQIKAPGPGKRARPGVFPLRQATLRTVADRTCERRFRRSRTKYRARFEAALMLCAFDANGRRPLDSVCAGDSGGPLISGTLARPVLLGVISWTGPRCGADRLPTVAAEVTHHLDFLTDPDPTWAPVPGGPPVIAGEPRAGSTLTCEVPPWEVAPEVVELRWTRRVRARRSYVFRPVGTGSTYTVQREDAGQLLRCEVVGSGPGGRTQAPPGPQSSTRVATG